MGFERATAALTADVFIAEYLALLDEGWTPDLKEFVQRIPPELQEVVFKEIDVALANRLNKEPEPQAPVQPQADTPAPPPVEAFLTTIAEPALPKVPSVPSVPKVRDVPKRPAPEPVVLKSVAPEPVAPEPVAPEAVAPEPTIPEPMIAAPEGSAEPATEILVEHFATATPATEELFEDAPGETVEEPAPTELEAPEELEKLGAAAEELPVASAPGRDEQVLPKPLAAALPEPDQIVVEAAPAPGAQQKELPRRTYTPSRLLKTVSKVIPSDIRLQWMGELLASRADQRDFGMPQSEIGLYTVERVVDGVAQRAPLQPLPEQKGDGNRVADLGWLTWRLSGPALFGGYLAGSAAMMAIGAAMLIAAVIVVFVHAARKSILDFSETRLLNGVLGSCVVCITFAFVAGILTALIVALSAVIGQAQIAASAVNVLAFCVTGLVCMLSLRGWLPVPWQPKRLIRV